jgi:hypothetical protein
MHLKNDGWCSSRNLLELCLGAGGIKVVCQGDMVWTRSVCPGGAFGEEKARGAAMHRSQNGELNVGASGKGNGAGFCPVVLGPSLC